MFNTAIDVSGNSSSGRPFSAINRDVRVRPFASSWVLVIFLTMFWFSLILLKVNQLPKPPI